MKKFYGILFSVLGLALAFYLIQQVEMHQILSSLDYFSWKWVIVAFFFYFASAVLRSIRWRSMLVSPVPLALMVAVTCIHNFLNHILPARTGELSYVVLLHKRLKVSFASGTATLIAARLMDLVAMGFFFISALFFYWHRITVPGFRLLTVTFLSIPIIVVLILCVLSRKASHYYLRKFSPRLGMVSLEKIFQFIERLSQELHEIKVSGRLWTYVGTTFLAWAAKFASFYCVCRLLPLRQLVHLGETILGTTFSELASTLPFYGFAGIGTIEGGWTLGFTLLGFEVSSVIASAFVFHFYVFCFSLFLALASFLTLRKQ